jgi:hypothetical protein
MHDILLMEQTEIMDPTGSQIELQIQFLQRLPAIGFKIPQRMIQVEEKVFILHGANYEL